MHVFSSEKKKGQFFFSIFEETTKTVYRLLNCRRYGIPSHLNKSSKIDKNQQGHTVWASWDFLYYRRCIKKFSNDMTGCRRTPATIKEPGTEKDVDGGLFGLSVQVFPRERPLGFARSHSLDLTSFTSQHLIWQTPNLYLRLRDFYFVALRGI